jgi:hypothetical protein
MQLTQSGSRHPHPAHRNSYWAMKALCLSADLELALLRQAILTLHGVEVDIARSKKEAASLLENQT